MLPSTIYRSLKPLEEIRDDPRVDVNLRMKAIEIILQIMDKNRDWSTKKKVYKTTKSTKELKMIVSSTLPATQPASSVADAIANAKGWDGDGSASAPANKEN